MTYRERIQGLIERMQTIYDECEGLRDFADLNEKQAWNDTRKIFYDAHKPLQRLDNSLSQSRANEECK